MLMQQIAERARNQETGVKAAEFNCLASLLMRANGSLSRAREIVETDRRHPTPSGVQSVLKDASSITGLAAAAGYSGLAAAFQDSLRWVSAFDAVYSGGAIKVPFRVRLLFASTTAIGSEVAEGAPKPVSRLELEAGGIGMTKATAIIVASRESIEQAVSGTQGLIGRELRRALVKSQDEAFIAGIMPGGSPPPVITSTDPVSDLAAALAALTTGADSRLLIIVAVDVAKMLTTATVSGSGLLFPQMTPSGGSIAGMTVTVTDALDDGTMLVVDASAFAMAADPVILSAARHASLQLDDAPASGPQNLTSLWQTDSIALRAERYFGWDELRADAVAAVEGINY